MRYTVKVQLQRVPAATARAVGMAALVAVGVVWQPLQSLPLLPLLPLPLHLPAVRGALAVLLLCVLLASTACAAEGGELAACLRGGVEVRTIGVVPLLMLLLLQTLLAQLVEARKC